MFNEDASQVLLVRGFKHNSSWSFPRGKINENELPKDCAIREVREETGFNIAPYMSLPSSSSEDSKLSAIRKTRPTNPTPNGQNHHHQSHKPHSNCTLHSEGDDHFIEITIREQRLRMYLVTGIPNDTKFVTQTRQEIGVSCFQLTH
jgi:mRNA-decapping enzyme subunit 2